MIYDIGNRDKILAACNKISKIISTLEENSCLNNITNSNSDNIVQNLIYTNYFEKSSSDSEILKIITRDCMTSEAISAGSGDLSALILNYFIKNISIHRSRRSRINALNSARNEILDAASYFSKHTRKISKDDMADIIGGLNISQDLSENLKFEILNCLIGSNFDVSVSKKSETSFVKNNGNRIFLETDQLGHMGISSWHRDYVNVILIDGTIESVSQVHHLLEKASSEKESYLVICRSASEEVKRTILLNNIRRTIDLFLLEIDFNVDVHHFFDDMSALFSCDYVNSKMGDTISSKIEKLMFVLDRVEIDGKSVNFKKENRDENYISNYIREIQSIKTNFDQSKDPDSFTILSKVIDSRVKFLSSSMVLIKIGQDDISFNPNTVSIVGNLFRSFPDMCITGIVDPPDEKSENSIVNIIMKGRKNKFMTQRQLFQSLVSSYRTYETIIKLEKIFTTCR